MLQVKLNLIESLNFRLIFLTVLSATAIALELDIFYKACTPHQDRRRGRPGRLSILYWFCWLYLQCKIIESLQRTITRITILPTCQL